MAKQKCARCKKDLTFYTMVLTNGSNGYRRYPLCDKCKAEVQKKESPKAKQHG